MLEFTSNSLQDQENLPGVEVGIFISRHGVVAVPPLGSHGYSALHVVGLEVGESEVVGQSVQRVYVERSDTVPVAVRHNSKVVILVLHPVLQGIPGQRDISVETFLLSIGTDKKEEK